jgi:hypothetical protein
MWSGSKEGSYLRLIDFAITLGPRVIKEKKKYLAKWSKGGTENTHTSGTPLGP